MVEATLNYLRPGGPPNRRFVAPGVEMNTGAYTPCEVRVADARPVAPTLASHGFALVDHRSAVADFADTAEVDRIYFAESDALVRATAGAALTIPFGWMRRSSAAAPGAAQPPAADVHVDLTPDRAARIGPAFLARDGHDPARYGRFGVFSLWRAVSPPPQDWPLALCAGWSVGDGEGSPNVMIQVDELPEGEAAFAPIPGEDAMPAASVFAHQPGHRWFYYPDMTRDEAVLITFYDSAHGPNWRVPHTAFEDRGVRAPAPRQSIELRTVAYWAAET